MSGERVEEAVTLGKVAASGIRKALENGKKRAQLDATILGTATTRKHAPLCGVSALLPGEEDDENCIGDPPANAQQEAQHLSTVQATADVAGEWVAEDTLVDDSAEFCWEEDEEADDVDLDANASITIDASGEPTCEAEASLRLARRRQALAAQTRMRRILHRVSVLVWIARGISMDAAANLQTTQSRMLSVVGDSIPGAAAANLQKPETTRLVQRAAQWMCHNFELCDAEDQEDWGAAHEALVEEVSMMEGDGVAATIAPTTKRAAAQLLMCIEVRQGTEEQLGALFIALLRAKGFIARHAISLPVVPRNRQIKFTKPATSKANQNLGPMIAQPMKWRGKAKVVVAMPPPKAGPSRKRKHSSSSKRPAEDDAAKKASTSTGHAIGQRVGSSGEGEAQGKAGCARVGDVVDCTSTSPEEGGATEAGGARAGDEEFERQLQMAMLATSEEQKTRDAHVGGTAASSSGVSLAAATDRYKAVRPARSASMFWAEVFCGSQATGAWLHADGVSGRVDKVAEVEASGRTGPVLTYVLAFTAAGVKDVSRRYAKDFERTLRGRDETWFAEVIAPLRAKAGAMVAPAAPPQSATQHNNALPQAATGNVGATTEGPASAQQSAQIAQLAEKREDAELEQAELKQRQKLPQNIEGFRKHPLYVLKRHISKYQGLKTGSAPLGLHRGEAYYDRSALSELHSAVKWKRKGREVLPGELGQPCKLVEHGKKGKAESAAKATTSQPSVSGAATSEPAGEDNADEEPKGRTTEMYGIWQTQPWALPAAKNGKVPRNDYGNVEVPPLTSILPAGTVHIDLPRAAEAARHLEVDAAPALVGFEAGRQGKIVAMFRGVVVCLEHEEAVRSAAGAVELAQQEAARERRMAKGRYVWLQLLGAVHERIKLQHDVDEAARCQRETRAGDVEPANSAHDGATGSLPADGGVKKKARKGSKGGSKMGGMLRKQVSALVNHKGKSTKRS